MSMARCSQCHASIPVPAALDVVTIRCEHCGLEQQVPDLETRRKLLLEEQREARLRGQAEAQATAAQRSHELALKKDQREDQDRARERRSRPFKWLAGLIPMLIAPVIIAVVVFDAPARLGFGESGSDRLEQYVTQAKATGCTVLRPIESEYANSTVSKLVPVRANQCIRVIAAGGPGHSSLSLKLYSTTKLMGTTERDSLDPQADYCVTAVEPIRVELGIGPAAKGRLSTVVLVCPPPKH